MVKKAEPLLDIDLGKNGGRLVAKTLDDAGKWIQEERNHWDWMSAISPRINELQQIWVDWSTVLTQLSKAITQTKLQEGQPRYQQQIEGLGSSISRPYTSRKIFHSSTPEAKFIEGLRESESDLTAISALAYLLNHPFPLNQCGTKTGLLEAFLFKKGIRSRTASEKKALEHLRAEWQENLNNLTNDHTALIDETGSLQQSLRDTLESATESLSAYNLKKQQEAATLFTDTKDSLNELRSESENKLNNLITTFDEKLSLQAPVSYWTRKKKLHKAKASQMLFNLWVFGLLGLGSILTAGATILGPVDKPAASEYFFLAIFTGAILWILRIFVKLYLSQLHLELDAQERVTLAQSYLAFLRRGKGVEESDRHIILESLFRHSSTGLQNDDGGNPHALLDLAERLKR